LKKKDSLINNPLFSRSAPMTTDQVEQDESDTLFSKYHIPGPFI
jgi:hypothetical protein